MSKNTVKKIPERKCMGCNEKKPKMQLVRVVRTPDNEVSLDLTGKVSGRGAYVCSNIKCLEKAIKSNRIERCLEIQIPDSVYDQMRKTLSEVSEDA
jgi:predicted RNA-binding protein YlxR (DUF448 family)